MDHVRNGKNGDYSNNKVDSRSSQVLEEIRHAEAVQTLQRAKIEAVRIINFLQNYLLSQCPRTDLNKRSLPRPKTTTA